MSNTDTDFIILDENPVYATYRMFEIFPARDIPTIIKTDDNKV
jgi:hypothetical protein